HWDGPRLDDPAHHASPAATSPVSSRGRRADRRLRRPEPRVPGLRLPARPGPGRGALLALVAPPRLELLQQGPAGGVARPRELRAVRRAERAARRLRDA